MREECEVMKQILYHVTKKENFDSIMKHGLIPQIGERSEQLNEEKGIFLFPTFEDMDTALGQWLGWEFEDDDELYALTVVLPDDFPLEEPVGFERVSRIPISPECIAFHSEQ